MNYNIKTLTELYKKWKRWNLVSDDTKEDQLENPRRTDIRLKICRRFHQNLFILTPSFMTRFDWGLFRSYVHELPAGSFTKKKSEGVKKKIWKKRSFSSMCTDYRRLVNKIWIHCMSKWDNSLMAAAGPHLD
jgi:hypothetical protein